MKSIYKLTGTLSAIVLLVIGSRFSTCSATDAAIAGKYAIRHNEQQRDLQLGGGWSPVPNFDTDGGVAAAASFAFETLQSSPSAFSISNDNPQASADATGYVVVGASSQVVAGTNYELDMIFTDSSGACVGAATVVVYDDINGGMSITSWVPNPSGCPATTQPITGGWSPVPNFQTDGEVAQAASFAYEQLISPSTSYSISNNPDAAADVTGYVVVAASEQVVAGLNIELDMIFLDSSGACIGGANVVVYDQFGDMSITSWNSNPSACPATDPPTEAPLVGGWTPVSDYQTNGEVKAAGSFAFQQLQASPSAFLISDNPDASADATGFRITGASEQVVAGMNYELEMVFVDDLGACVGGATVVVYDRFGDMSITSWTENPSACIDDSNLDVTDSEPLAGGWAPVTDLETNEGVLEAANFAFEEFQSSPSNYSISEDTDASDDVTGYQVVSASEQVVAGMNYELNMIFTDSSEACVGAATVVVYDQFGDMSITSWEPNPSGCDTSSASDPEISAGYCNAKGSLYSFMAMIPLMLMLE